MQREKLNEWLDHPVTQMQEKAILLRIEESKDRLIGYNEREADLVLKGMIQAFYEILDHKNWTQDIHIEEDNDTLQTGDAG